MHNARNTLIPATLALLLSVGVYVYIFFQVNNAGREVDSIEQKIEAEHEKTRRRDAVRTTLEDTEDDRVELESRLLKDATLVSFFETLETLAFEAGVKTEIGRISENVELDLIIPDPTEEGADTKPVRNPASDSLEWLQLDIKATGTWSQVYRFLSYIELLPYETQQSNVRLQTIATPSIVELDEEGEPVSLASFDPDSWELTFTLKALKIKTQ
jgi:hypothetical protein